MKKRWQKNSVFFLFPVFWQICPVKDPRPSTYSAVYELHSALQHNDSAFKRTTSREYRLVKSCINLFEASFLNHFHDIKKRQDFLEPLVLLYFILAFIFLVRFDCTLT